MPLYKIGIINTFADHKNQLKSMLIIDITDSESLDRALKKYKKKFEKAGILRELRSRQAFIKPSIIRRTEILKARYREHMINNMEI